MKSIKINGAGLAGLTAAYLLSKEGYGVEVYEKKDVVGHEFSKYVCALRNYDGYSVFRELNKFRIKLTDFSISPKVYKISPNYRVYVGMRSYYLIDMGQSEKSLEQQLYLMCLSEGVKVLTKNTCDSPDIEATGPTKKEKNIFGYGHVYKDTGIDSEEIYLIYNNDIAPKGYTFAVTRDEYTTVMAVSFDKNEFLSLNYRFEKSIKNFGFLNELVGNAEKTEEICGMAHYSPNPLKDINNTGVIYIGEAGGFQDASRGFGIRYAISSGALAAQSIIEGRDFSDLVTSYYKKEFEYNYKRREIQDSLTNDDYDDLIQFNKNANNR